MKSIIIIAFSIVLLAFRSHAGPSVEEAKKVFESYVELEAKFDPTVVDLFSDDAKIQNTRRNPDGTSRTMTLSGAQYKQLLKLSLPMAKQRGDTSKYSEVSYKEEDGKVRVSAVRYSELKKYSSPLSLLIAEREGKWWIVEELSESRP